MGLRCRPLSTFQGAAGGCPGRYIIPLLPLTCNTFLNRFSYSLWYKSTKNSAVLHLSSCFGIRRRPLYTLPVGFGEDIEDQRFYTDAFLFAEGDRDDLVVSLELDDRGVTAFPFLGSHWLLLPFSVSDGSGDLKISL